MIGPAKDSSGKWLTLALFWEERHDSYAPSFTLKSYDLEKDGIVYPSLKNIFLAYADPTEYSFAVEVLGGWEHWQMMNKSYKLSSIFQAWRDELDIKHQALGMKALIHASKDNDAKGVNAAKYLVEKGYIPKRGRPSKEEVERELKRSAKSRQELNADLERIGLKVVNGEKQ